jgi:hypothetical protein
LTALLTLISCAFPMPDVLNAMAVFVVVAETKGFRVAGERLYAAARPALEELRVAVAALGELGSEPRGTLRLHVAPAAESFLRGPLLAGFLAKHTYFQRDPFVSDAPVDIVAERYDAGIRLGAVIDRDMIAVPVSGDLPRSRRSGSESGVRGSRAPRRGSWAARCSARGVLYAVPGVLPVLPTSATRIPGAPRTRRLAAPRGAEVTRPPWGSGA